MRRPIDTVKWSADALERLDQLRQARDSIDSMIEQAVAECRRTPDRSKDGWEADPDATGRARPVQFSGVIPWAKIAEALGVTRQTAWQRFRDLE